MPPKPPKVDPTQAKFESDIQKKIERNLLFIDKLRAQDNPPPYS